MISQIEGCGCVFVGEQGALTMMPLFLLDQKIDPSEVSFWTGIVCQGISIGGSVLGGWLVTNFKYVAHFFCFNSLLAFFSTCTSIYTVLFVLLFTWYFVQK